MWSQMAKRTVISARLGDDHAALEHQFLHVAEGQREAEVQRPPRTIPLHRDQPENHPTQSANVTVPHRCPAD